MSDILVLESIIHHSLAKQNSPLTFSNIKFNLNLKVSCLKSVV